MATPQSRWFTRSRRVTWAAGAKASRTAAASPRAQRNATLPGASSWTRGASPARAWRAVTTAGSGSYATATSSAASMAAVGGVAMTAATAPPTWRTRSRARAPRGRPPLRPPAAGRMAPSGRPRPPPAAPQAGAGEDGHHARDGRGPARVDGGEPGVGVRRAHQGAVEGARHDEVVDEAAAPGQEPGVLAATDGSADALEAHEGGPANPLIPLPLRGR